MAHVGTAYARLEDDRFLTGRGRFVDDIRLAGEAHTPPSSAAPTSGC